MKIYELLTDRRKWTRYRLAVDRRGLDIGARDKRAVRWCLVGALDRCYAGREGERIECLLRAALRPQSIPDWNDRATFRQVRALVKRLDV